MDRTIATKGNDVDDVPPSADVDRLQDGLARMNVSHRSSVGANRGATPSMSPRSGAVGRGGGSQRSSSGRGLRRGRGGKGKGKGRAEKGKGGDRGRDNSGRKEKANSRWSGIKAEKAPSAVAEESAVGAEGAPMGVHRLVGDVRLLLASRPADQAVRCLFASSLYPIPDQVAQEKDEPVRRCDAGTCPEDEFADAVSAARQTFGSGAGGLARLLSRGKGGQRLRRKDYFNFPLGNVDQSDKENLRQELIAMRESGLPLGFRNVVAYGLDKGGQLDVKYYKVPRRDARVRMRKRRENLKKARLFKWIQAEFAEFWSQFGEKIVAQKWTRTFGAYMEEAGEEHERDDQVDLSSSKNAARSYVTNVLKPRVLEWRSQEAAKKRKNRSNEVDAAENVSVASEGNVTGAALWGHSLGQSLASVQESAGNWETRESTPTGSVEIVLRTRPPSAQWDPSPNLEIGVWHANPGQGQEKWSPQSGAVRTGSRENNSLSPNVGWGLGGSPNDNKGWSSKSGSLVANLSPEIGTWSSEGQQQRGGKSTPLSDKPTSESQTSPFLDVGTWDAGKETSPVSSDMTGLDAGGPAEPKPSHEVGCAGWSQSSKFGLNWDDPNRSTTEEDESGADDELQIEEGDDWATLWEKTHAMVFHGTRREFFQSRLSLEKSRAGRRFDHLDDALFWEVLQESRRSAEGADDLKWTLAPVREKASADTPQADFDSSTDAQTFCQQYGINLHHVPEKVRDYSVSKYDVMPFSSQDELRHCTGKRDLHVEEIILERILLRCRSDVLVVCHANHTLIIGSDGNALSRIRSLAKEKDLDGRVDFVTGDPSAMLLRTPEVRSVDTVIMRASSDDRFERDVEVLESVLCGVTGNVAFHVGAADVARVQLGRMALMAPPGAQVDFEKHIVATPEGEEDIKGLTVFFGNLTVSSQYYDLE